MNEKHSPNLKITFDELRKLRSTYENPSELHFFGVESDFLQINHFLTNSRKKIFNIFHK